MWAEYTAASLTAEQKDTRPYKQGRQSLDGRKVFVRFISDETPWDGALASTSVVEDARAMISGADYLEPPSVAEQIEAALQRQSEIAKQKEAEGVVWTDKNGDTFLFTSNQDDHVRYSAAQLAMTKGKRGDGTRWPCAKVVDGKPVLTFRPTNNAELSDIVDAAYEHSVKVVTALAAASDKILAGDLTATFEAEFAAL